MVLTGFACFFSGPNKVFAGKIALSFDDAPRKETLFLKGKDRAEILVQELKKSKVDEVMFFVTTEGLSRPETKRRVARYNQAGHLIANHTHSHERPDDLGVDAYVEDVKRADSLVRVYSNFVPFFRYPYLDYGKTQKTRDQVRSQIRNLGYKNGYVTVDNFDWYFDHAVQEALRQGRHVNLKRLRKAYVHALWDSIQFYDNLSKVVLGRSVRHVLLLHENDVAAMFVSDLVAHIKSKGWEIISPLEAYKDPIADIMPETLRNNNGKVAAIATEQGYEGSTRDFFQNSEAIDDLLKERNVFD